MFRTPSLISSRFSARCFFSLDLALFFSPSISLHVVCSFLFRLVSLDGVSARSKTRHIINSMKLRYRTNERIYRAITRLNRVVIVYQCRKKKSTFSFLREGALNVAKTLRIMIAKHAWAWILSFSLSFLLFSLYGTGCKMLDEPCTFFRKKIELSNTGSTFPSFFFSSPLSQIWKM